MTDARFYTVEDERTGEVRCDLCAHRCRIMDGRRGICMVRENRGGTLRSLVYGRLVSGNADPVEKKPLFHFLPGSLTWSIATVGCNFRCRHCQNSEISQYPATNRGAIAGRETSPAAVVEAALATGCSSISYTYVEPTVFMEFALDCAELASRAGLQNIFVSNGYTSEEAALAITPFLGANNIDLKSFSDSFYRKICGARLQPVLDTIIRMKKAGVWVEITTLVIPGLNDSDAELADIAAFIAGVDRDIPWHVTRFHPAFGLTDRPPTPAATLRRARDAGLAAGLRHVYTGNLPGDNGGNTYCPRCGNLLMERTGFTSRRAGMEKGACRNCGTAVAGIWTVNPPTSATGSPTGSRV